MFGDVPFFSFLFSKFIENLLKIYLEIERLESESTVSQKDVSRMMDVMKGAFESSSSTGVLE